MRRIWGALPLRNTAQRDAQGLYCAPMMRHIPDMRPIARAVIRAYRINMRYVLRLLRLSYGQKLFLLATLPLVLAVVLIALMVAVQARALADREIQTLEARMITAKKAELKNYLSLARTAFSSTYGRARPDDEEAKLLVSQVLAAMVYGQDGYFFVYHYDGTNIVSPRRTELINRNWLGMRDANGTEITDELIRLARTGGGYHSFEWPKPSTGQPAQMTAYVIGLQDWQWAVGTGIFTDDVVASTTAAKRDMETRIQRTFIYIAIITFGALMLVFITGMAINIRERRLADAKLKALTQRVFDAQEEERGRVARELHDGISQILVGIKYALDMARRRMGAGDERGLENLERGIGHLSGAISEVRRISRDLRPGVLDDLGLGPALKTLAEDFAARTGVTTDFNTVVFRNRLDNEARIALYRIAQEALTNIERHAAATRVSIDLGGHARGARLRIADNGQGLPQENNSASGLGLRNMQERASQLGGDLILTSDQNGTVIVVNVPLSHMLGPEAPAPEAP